MSSFHARCHVAITPGYFWPHASAKAANAVSAAVRDGVAWIGFIAARIRWTTQFWTVTSGRIVAAALGSTDHLCWGYGRAHANARAYGWSVNHTNTQRLWSEEGSRVPQKRKRKRGGAFIGSAPVTAAYPYRALAIDFYADHPVDVSITGEHLVGSLERLSITHGLPAILRMDNGPEMTCRAIAEWVHDAVALVFIPPAEPWKNGYVESFHSHQRDEYLNITAFPSLLHARVQLTDWHHEYNHMSMHSSLGYKTLTEYAEHCTCTKLD